MIVVTDASVRGGSTGGKVGEMEISDGEQRSIRGGGEWWCGMQSPVDTNITILILKS